MKPEVRDYIYSPEFSIMLNMTNLTSEQAEKALESQKAICEDIDLFFCEHPEYGRLMGRVINQKIINFVKTGNYLSEWEMQLWGL